MPHCRPLSALNALRDCALHYTPTKPCCESAFCVGKSAAKAPSVAKAYAQRTGIGLSQQGAAGTLENGLLLLRSSCSGVCGRRFLIRPKSRTIDTPSRFPGPIRLGQKRESESRGPGISASLGARRASGFGRGPRAPGDLQHGSFCHRRADNRTFRPPVTPKTAKSSSNFQKMLKIVQTSLASRPSNLKVSAVRGPAVPDKLGEGP